MHERGGVPQLDKYQKWHQISPVQSFEYALFYNTYLEIRELSFYLELWMIGKTPTA